MQVIEGKFEKEKEATLREMLLEVLTNIKEEATGDFVLVFEVDGVGEVYTSQTLAETYLMIDLAKNSMISDVLEKSAC